MRLRQNISLILWAATLLGALLLFAWIKAEAAKKYKHFVTQVEASHQSLLELQAQNGQLIAQNRVLELRTNELSVFMPELKAEIANLKVKLSRAESISQTGFSAQSQVVVIVRDSVVYDTIHAKVFNYQDGYFSISGELIGDKQHLNLAYQDTLVQVVYWGARKHPWMWVFSPRELSQRVSLKNPNARIHYTQTIKISR